jgi:rhodanese-related sulfurtransferase
MNDATATEKLTLSRINAREAHALADQAVFVDVRTPAEYTERHIEWAVSHPFSRLDPESVKSLTGGKRPCIVVCLSGNRATRAAEKLSQAGLSAVHVLDGGIERWETAGLPVVRGRKTMSLERQVRIAAGTLVFIGTVLGLTVNAGFFALPAFVGAGLVFAGVTDTCGMGMLLAKMPWNQR